MIQSLQSLASYLILPTITKSSFGRDLGFWTKSSQENFDIPIMFFNEY